jgi:hypothetical protein
MFIVADQGVELVFLFCFWEVVRLCRGLFFVLVVFALQGWCLSHIGRSRGWFFYICIVT